MTQDRRMTLTVALAVVLASTALFPPFYGAVWFNAGIGAVITVAAAGTLSRLRTLPPVVCLLISLAGLTLFLNLAFEAHLSFWWVVPTRASMTALGELTTTGFREAGSYSPPVSTTVTGLVFLAVAGIGITAVLTDLIAVRLRSTAMAGLPLLVLFTVPNTINVQRSGISTAVIFILGTGGYLAMLSADGRERIRVWGRLVSLWRPDGSSRYAGPGVAPVSTPDPGAGGRHRTGFSALRGPDTRGLAAAGRRVGLASIVIALLAPLLVPGLHAARLASSDWVFGNGTGTGGTPIPDFLSVVSQQLQGRPHVVMTYVTNDQDPGYLQQEVRYTLTDTNGWEEPFEDENITTYPFSTLPAEQGVASPGSLVTTTITTAQGAFSSTPGFNELPAPFPPVSVTNLPGTWQDDPNTLMIISQDASLDQLTYAVESRNDVADRVQLEKAAPPPADMSQYLQLPPTYAQSKALIQLTRSITKGATTEVDKANDLANYMHSTGGFVYDLFAPEITNVSDLLEFLQKTKAGDCVQAAYAMTVMLRLLDIPSRLVLGYTQGTETSAGHYTVMSSDAHAWPEAYFSGYGWVRFEPVPPGGVGTSVTPNYSVPGSTTTTSGGSDPVISGQSTGSTSTKTGPGGHRLTEPGSGGPPGELPFVAVRKPVTGTPWTALALAVIAALALACGIIAIVAPLGQVVALSEGRQRRWRLNGGLLLLIAAGAVIVVIALERLLTHTRGLNVTSGWETVGIAFGAACVAALAVPIACRPVIRRWRWRRAADDAAARAHIAWLELRADLADYGLAPLPSESPRALAGRVTSGLALAEPAAEAVGRIALAEERATYSAQPAEAETLHKDSRAARHGIAAAAGRGARWRAWLFPASMMAAIADAVGRVPGAWAGWTARLSRRRR
jgi:transglutaminase-like putative cysteine protease